MVKPKLSPGEIVRRLQMIEALAAEGLSVAEALRSVGVPQVEYDRWRIEYPGLGRTLGPLLVRDAQACEENAPFDARSSTQAAQVTRL